MLRSRTLEPFNPCVVLAAVLAGPTAVQGQSAIPQLRERGTGTQLVVDGEPFLIRGGELGNSTASDLDDLEAFWPMFRALDLNTVLAPVYWERIEPAEGQLDFTLVDGLIEQARSHDMRLVLLWFGSWKNSMSSYVPGWIKTDQERFPRTEATRRRGQEILSPFSVANAEADARAFAALMGHLREIDGDHRTVLMVQVENEVGMIPEARDHSATADSLFAEPVPRPLMDHLQRTRTTLHPDVRARWEAAGGRTSGTWEQVFGPGVYTDELFMAWHFARYVERVAAAGKAEYPLPMYVNAALIRPGYLPGQYVSAGPLPHLLEVWRAGAPSAPLGEGYALVKQLAPLIAEHQGQGTMTAVMPPIAFDGAVDDSPQEVSLERLDYTLTVDFTTRARTPGAANPGAEAAAGSRPAVPRGGIFIALGADEFLVAGTGMVITFAPRGPGDPIVGILSAREGRFVDGRWEGGRWLNGDQTHQGRHIRLGSPGLTIQRVRLYRYR